VQSILSTALIVAKHFENAYAFCSSQLVNVIVEPFALISTVTLLQNWNVVIWIFFPHVRYHYARQGKLLKHCKAGRIVNKYSVRINVMVLISHKQCCITTMFKSHFVPVF